jgi:hypothetical protein
VLTDGYEEAKRDLLALLAKRNISHAHDLAGSYTCMPCVTGYLTVTLAWLGVDPELQPILGSETKMDTEENA